MGKSAQNLIDHGFYLIFCEWFPLLFHLCVHFVDVVIEVLENHVEFFRYQEYFLQFYNVGMVKFSEGFDLSKFNAFIPIAIFSFHFLDCDHFPCFDIGGLVDCAEGSIPQSFDCFVFLHNMNYIVRTVMFQKN